MISIGRLDPADRAGWEVLFGGYNDFYQHPLPQQAYDRAWAEFQADTRMHALGARLSGRLVGIAHFLVHPSTTAPDVCYLEDLFTAPDARGQGVGGALIGAVADWARDQACSGLYWLTHESNATARRLYDQLASHDGFIMYRMPL
jgi:GNAT superfamily N-acetyltransferase